MLDVEFEKRLHKDIYLNGIDEICGFYFCRRLRRNAIHRVSAKAKAKKQKSKQSTNELHICRRAWKIIQRNLVIY